MRKRWGGRLLPAVAATGASLALAATAGASDQERIEIRDACDPATFNAAVGPGTCVRDGSSGKFMTFEEFIERLAERREVGAWRFKPSDRTVDEGTRLLADNSGGEFHTFTEVDAFGPGCVPELNQLVFGDPAVSPLCTDEVFAATGLPAGARREFSGFEPGKHRFLCLIHPWMKSTITVR